MREDFHGDVFRNTTLMESLTWLALWDEVYEFVLVWDFWTGQPFGDAGPWPVQGVYVFADYFLKWEPTYIGKSADLTRRMRQHPAWRRARRWNEGALLMCEIRSSCERSAVEAAMCREFQPRSNIRLCGWNPPRETRPRIGRI